MKKKITGLIVFLVAITVTLVAFLPLEYAKNKEGKSWMKSLGNDIKLAQVSIPGTHDSGALYSIADLSGRCQTLTIKNQMEIGVRFFDIRLKQDGDDLKVVHSFVDQKTDFAKVLRQMENFLKENPSEFLIVSIKEDADAKNPTEPFDKAVKKALEKQSSVVNFSTELAKTVGEARGKIHIISRFNGDFGVPCYYGWQDSTSFEIGEIFVQDNYCITEVDTKINDIKVCFEKSSSLEYSLCINFASCYLDGAFPPTYAGTPARTINEWLLANLSSQNGSLGVVLCDFITTDLAKAIYRRNIV